MSAPASRNGERASAPFTSLSGVAEAVPDFDGFLIDQWGVLHDGKQAYEGAVGALERLRDAGKRVVILSNSGRSGRENERLLDAMGFGRTLFHAVISAGDDARDALLNDPDPFYRRRGARCVLLARAGEEYLAEGLGLTLVSDLDTAELLLLMTMDPASQSVAQWEPLLERAQSRGLPMICANPDIVRVSPDGQLLEAPGAVAQRYADMGGVVRYHGKPHRRIYATALSALGMPACRVAMIGDSLEHDVAGARVSGLKCIFVAGGIHRDQMAWVDGLPRPDDCSRLFAEAGMAPDFVVPGFRW